MLQNSHEFELSVGDVLQVGNLFVTVVDVDGPDVSFRFDNPDDETNVRLQLHGPDDEPILREVSDQWWMPDK